ncbi:TonB-dependent receptor [Flavobacterium rhamnosiphilum]|uniref:TonB-dependent receptor n=1 Tax=Flavobacterium rhamnosiphilum TaxID=2541724 RepID=A0A4R5F501_9FLAO|nr:outer membrane beta-barrel family protein [Flavobacterium rhamnosiphilum]TDE42681.1 TonB-dependent receptor [Flavobacterium rhamnosiphilum]
MMSKICLVTFFLIAFLPNNLLSQTSIKGTIVDANNIPIESAEVILLSKESKIAKGDLSDIKGFFDITIKNGNYTLQINHNGVFLFSKEIVINKNMDLGIIKLETTQLLKEVIVQAKKQLFKREFDKIIFIVENSPLKEGYNGLEVLQRSPKIKVNSEGGISLKNGNPSVNINGRKLNLSSDELSNYLSSLNSETIKQIEIQEVGSPEADASNIGGIINIVTKKNPKGFSSLSKGYIGHKEKNFQKYQLGNTIIYGSDKWNLYSRVNYTDNDDRGKVKSTATIFNTNIKQKNEGFFIESDKTITLTNGVVSYPNKKNEFGVEFFFNKQKKGIDSNKDLNIYNSNILETSSKNLSISSVKQNTWYTTFNYTLKKDTLGSTIKFIGDIGQNNIDNTNNIVINYFLGNLSNSNSRFTADGIANYNTFQLDWKQNTSKKINFSTGIKNNYINRKNTLIEESLIGNNWQLNPNGFQNFTNRENIFASYFTFNTKWKENNTVKFGLRIENTYINGFNRINSESVTQNYTDFFPSFYYGYDFGNDKYISLSYSKSIQRPSFRDLNPFVLKLDDFYYQKGNPNLKPQYSNKIDVSYQLKNHDFSFYMNFVNDLIAPAYTLTDENVRIYQSQNFGNEKNYGISYDYSGDLTKWLFLNFTFSTKYYEFNSKNDFLKTNKTSFVNNIFANIKLTKTLSIDVFSVYFSKFQYHVMDDFGAYNLDISIQKKIWNDKGLIKLSFFDIFDTMRAKNASTYGNFEFEFFQKRLTQSIALYFQYKIVNSKKVNDKSVRSENQTRQRL